MKNSVFKKRNRVYLSSFQNILEREFPKINYELNSIQFEEKCNNVMNKVDMYKYDEIRTIPILIRLTMPFAFLVLLMLFVLKPIIYVITGSWYINTKKCEGLYSWIDMVLD
jgi:hypothetical protein